MYHIESKTLTPICDICGAPVLPLTGWCIKCRLTTIETFRMVPKDILGEMTHEPEDCLEEEY